jgi:hypothetical protein
VNDNARPSRPFEGGRFLHLFFEEEERIFCAHEPPSRFCRQIESREMAMRRQDE